MSNNPTSTYACPEVLVDTQWLNEHLNDSQVRILEVEMTPEACHNAHIPGAVFWHIPTDLMLPDFIMNLDPSAFQQLLARSGITPETTVVAYGHYPGIGGVIFWLMQLFGHQNVKVLNGGYSKWTAEKRPLTTALSTPTPVPTHGTPPNPALRVKIAEVQAKLNSTDHCLIDVRSPQEYNGEWFMDHPPTETEIAGHIPGAIHIEHLLTLNPDGTFKSVEELQTLFHSQGVTADKEIFPYCAIGGRSAYMWFVLKYLLGYPKVRNFDGSWIQWSRVVEVNAH